MKNIIDNFEKEQIQKLTAKKNIPNFKTDILDKFNYLIKIENYSEKL